MMTIKLVDYLDDPDHDNEEYMPYCDACQDSSETIYKLIIISGQLEFYLCENCKSKLKNTLNQEPIKDLKFIKRYA